MNRNFLQILVSETTHTFLSQFRNYRKNSDFKTFSVTIYPIFFLLFASCQSSFQHYSFLNSINQKSKQSQIKASSKQTTPVSEKETKITLIDFQESIESYDWNQQKPLLLFDDIKEIIFYERFFQIEFYEPKKICKSVSVPIDDQQKRFTSPLALEGSAKPSRGGSPKPSSPNPPAFVLGIERNAIEGTSEKTAISNSTFTDIGGFAFVQQDIKNISEFYGNKFLIYVPPNITFNNICNIFEQSLLHEKNFHEFLKYFTSTNIIGIEEGGSARGGSPKPPSSKPSPSTDQVELDIVYMGGPLRSASGWGNPSRESVKPPRPLYQSLSNSSEVILNSSSEKQEVLNQLPSTDKVNQRLWRFSEPSEIEVEFPRHGFILSPHSLASTAINSKVDWKGFGDSAENPTQLKGGRSIAKTSLRFDPINEPTFSFGIKSFFEPETYNNSSNKTVDTEVQSQSLETKNERTNLTDQERINLFFEELTQSQSSSDDENENDLDTIPKEALQSEILSNEEFFTFYLYQKLAFRTGFLNFIQDQEFQNEDSRNLILDRFSQLNRHIWKETEYKRERGGLWEGFRQPEPPLAKPWVMERSSAKPPFADEKCFLEFDFDEQENSTNFELSFFNELRKKFNYEYQKGEEYFPSFIFKDFRSFPNYFLFLSATFIKLSFMSLVFLVSFYIYENVLKRSSFIEIKQLKISQKTKKFSNLIGLEKIRPDLEQLVLSVSSWKREGFLLTLNTYTQLSSLTNLPLFIFSMKLYRSKPSSVEPTAEGSAKPSTAISRLNFDFQKHSPFQSKSNKAFSNAIKLVKSLSAAIAMGGSGFAQSLLKTCAIDEGPYRGPFNWYPRPHLDKRLIQYTPRGFLFTGKPGTGKTLVAKAIAGEANVPFFYSSGSEYQTTVPSEGLKKLRTLFQIAKKRSPSIIFIDEIDLLGQPRKNFAKNQNSEVDLLTEFLTQVDGFLKSEKIILIGTTNSIKNLDPAFLRPGRFDRIFQFHLPTSTVRLKMLQAFCSSSKMNYELTEAQWSILESKTNGFSGGELEAIVNESLLKLIQDQKRTHSFETLMHGLNRITTFSKPNFYTYQQDVANTLKLRQAYHCVGNYFTELLYPRASLRGGFAGSRALPNPFLGLGKPSPPSLRRFSCLPRTFSSKILKERQKGVEMSVLKPLPKGLEGGNPPSGSPSRAKPSSPPTTLPEEGFAGFAEPLLGPRQAPNVEQLKLLLNEAKDLELDPRPKNFRYSKHKFLKLEQITSLQLIENEILNLLAGCAAQAYVSYRLLPKILLERNLNFNVDSIHKDSLRNLVQANDLCKYLLKQKPILTNNLSYSEHSVLNELKISESYDSGAASPMGGPAEELLHQLEALQPEAPPKGLLFQNWIWNEVSSVSNLERNQRLSSTSLVQSKYLNSQEFLTMSSEDYFYLNFLQTSLFLNQQTSSENNVSELLKYYFLILIKIFESNHKILDKLSFQLLIKSET